MFIVLEGIDGAGKGRQREELLARLASDPAKQITSVEFPDHQGFLYKEIIKPVLMQKKTATKNAMFLAFALDQLLYQEKIKDSLGSLTQYFICDGYFTTNLAYNCILNNYFTLDTAISLAHDFDIYQPDISLFLDVEPETCIARKQQEAGHEQGLDIYERSLAKQKKLQQAYLSMVKDHIFGKWQLIDGNGTIAEVSQLVYQYLLDNKFI